jgi:outer membrane protein assembly factor BamB
MVRRRIGGVVGLATTLVIIAALVAPQAVARSQSKWIPNSATRWEVGGGGDDFRTGYNPTEKQPPFIAGGNLASDDGDGPWLEWVTKISDLPSGVWPEAGMAVVDGIVYVSGAATNSFLALDAKTGLPIWRFSPDQRTDGATSAYPGSNAPAVKNGIVYATFSNGWMYALNAKTGKKIWSYRAVEGYKGPPPPNTTSGARCSGGKCVRSEDQFGQVHPGVDYPKIHGATAFCNNKVFFMTLSGWVYGLDAKTGKLLWKKYADGPEFPGELTWWEYGKGGALSEDNKSAGFSTRRFEAVPGLACLNEEVQVAGADGHVRFLNPNDGTTDTSRKEFDRTDDFGGNVGAVNFCANAGWNCDIAVGLALPSLGASGGGDYIVTTLDSRIIRLKWDSHDVVWRRTYNAPLPLELEVGGSSSFLLSLEHGEHGFITQAVVGGPMALDPDMAGNGADPILYAAAQDGRLYVLGLNRDGDAAGCLRSADPQGPCLIARPGISANTDSETPYTRRGEGGPWDFNQHALSGLVLGGDVLYVPTWDNKIHGYDVRDPKTPKKIWEHEIKWDTTFKYPPFGETYKEPFADIDNKIFSSPALLGGHLYFAANDGRVYAFNLQKKVKTVRNLVILGSGVVPFVPQWKDKLGTFDRVWTPADWYKNQVPPSGYRLPKAAGVTGAAALLLGNGILLWWYARRDDFEVEISS